jgi:hypothetical protein
MSSELLVEWELVLMSGKVDDGGAGRSEEQVGEGIEAVMIVGGKTSSEMAFVEGEDLARGNFCSSSYIFTVD